MPSDTAESTGLSSEQNELRAVLQSQLFVRAPTLAHLLSYLCEKKFAGESGQIKEYSLALDVFGRRESFDQDTDSIVRVQANRLRKRLAEYYSGEGASHALHITIPVGQYVPVFAECATSKAAPEVDQTPPASSSTTLRSQRIWLLFAVAGFLFVLGTLVFLMRDHVRPHRLAVSAVPQPASAELNVGLPVGDEIRILAGASRSYVDHAGKLWNSDAGFEGGVAVRSPVQHIWRTQDPGIYRSSRQGDFSYSVPLKAGRYELHLHFAETFYGPENAGGGGEGSRVMTVTANGNPLLNGFDVTADSGGGRVADVKVFTDIAPAADGMLHLSFSSIKGGRGMVSAIEVLPGTQGHLRPVRIVTREGPYYSNDSHWWSPDTYFTGGQLSSSEETAVGTDDPELYETERWGHFSYAIPVTPGKYTVILHFIQRSANHDKDLGLGSSPDPRSQRRVFSVFCNGKDLLRNLNILEESGENQPLVRKITGVEPNAQGKLLLEFVPISRYATVSAIEVLPQ